MTQYIARANIAVSGKVITAGDTFAAKQEDVQAYLVSGQAERVITEAKPAQKTQKVQTRRRK